MPTQGRSITDEPMPTSTIHVPVQHEGPECKGFQGIFPDRSSGPRTVPAIPVGMTISHVAGEAGSDKALLN